MLCRKSGYFAGLFTLLVAISAAGPLQALVPPDREGLRQAEFKAAELTIETRFRLPSELPDQHAAKAVTDLAALGLPAVNGHIDLRSDRWASILLAEPLLPGAGVGNQLGWPDLGRSSPVNDSKLADVALQAFLEFLQSAEQEFRIDQSELALGAGKTTVYRDGSLINIYLPRQYRGLRVRDSHLTAVLSHGNLVLFGARQWGDINTPVKPELTAEEASDAVQAHVGDYLITNSWGKTELLLLPVAAGADPERVPVGLGLDYRLAWVVRPRFDNEMARYEALVDAMTGRVLAFADTNHYMDIEGGVLPVSNDGVSPDGVEQPGWPMPYQDVTTIYGPLTTDTGGNVTATGSVTATFYGPYVNIDDVCGAESLTDSGGIDWGTSGGTDCTTPGFGGAGNTHASRTGFYELNKMIEMGRGQLPGNAWLQNRLTSNMNINQTCNAFWGGGTVNFYRSGGGCANTGELAGVFDHEWGHGLDNNDAFPTIAGPSGEGIADIYTALRLNSSCIGRGFTASNCSGFGDACTDCTGVRDIDYAMRTSGSPHTYTWSDANCSGSVHCVGSVYSEAVWSLWKRKLQSAPYNYDDNTAMEIVNQLTFIGAGNVGTWFEGGPPNGGCAAGSGYLNYLAADDDNGSLVDGTPHMTAIFDAFNDQEIACATPTVQDAGCAGTPSSAPVVATTGGHKKVSLSWGAVTNTTEYEVFRTEGVFACEFGKVRLGSTTNTAWEDTGLKNGREYHYVVIPKGASNSCFGPASACATQAPMAAPNFEVVCGPANLSIAREESDSMTCTVVSETAYTDDIDLSCSGNPVGVTCAFGTTPVALPADGDASSTLAIEVSADQPVGTVAFDVIADDGSETRSTPITVQVLPWGSDGPQDAAFDAGLGVPKCGTVGSSCDSLALLEGRGTLGPEPNQPNTLDVCEDGSDGTYLVDESLEAIRVSTLDGGNMNEGDTVEIAVTVHAWSTGASDTLDLYYADDASSPVWTFLTSIAPPGGSIQTLTAQYALPAGAMQAVRGNFRYTGAADPCSAGTYDDHDDLVFAVSPPDADSDGVWNADDNCPSDFNPGQEDFDGDGAGYACDTSCAAAMDFVHDFEGGEVFDLQSSGMIGFEGAIADGAMISFDAGLGAVLNPGTSIALGAEFAIDTVGCDHP